MELTPKFARMDVSEDSGFISRSSIESSSICEVTPILPQQFQAKDTCTPHLNVAIRKRKLSSTQTDALIKTTSNELSNETPLVLSASKRQFLSSTLNECMDISNFVNESITPNFYIERNDFESTSSKFDSARSKSAPSTPPRLKDILDIDENFSLSQIKLKSSTTKLGSPERNEILYPEVKHFQSVYKASTPQKFTESFRRHTPAKKRLFSSAKKEKLDPIVFFFNEKKQYKNLVERILTYLTDKDLYTFSKVSNKWRNALFSCKSAEKRLGQYVLYFKANKENFNIKMNKKDEASANVENSLTLSPKSKHFRTFIEYGKYLKQGQSLQKCPNCNFPAVVDQNISQCQKELCGYICCNLCGSFSTTGPENFIDKCQNSRLVVEDPLKNSDSPNSLKSASTIPQMFTIGFGTPENSPQSLEKSVNSSAYNFSGTDIVKSAKRKSSILHDLNKDLTEVKKQVNRRSSLASVVPILKKQPELLEPSSPPKIKNATVGSKQSKKNLKRLLR